jgi:hypothetical protein
MRDSETATECSTVTAEKPKTRKFTVEELGSEDIEKKESNVTDESQINYDATVLRPVPIEPQPVHYVDGQSDHPFVGKFASPMLHSKIPYLGSMSENFNPPSAGTRSTITNTARPEIDLQMHWNAPGNLNQPQSYQDAHLPMPYPRQTQQLINFMNDQYSYMTNISLPEKQQRIEQHLPITFTYENHNGIEKQRKMRKKNETEIEGCSTLLLRDKKMVLMGGVKRRTGKALAGDHMQMKFTFM